LRAAGSAAEEKINEAGGAKPASLFSNSKDRLNKITSRSLLQISKNTQSLLSYETRQIFFYGYT
jgi:hypothetical protein